VVYQRTDTLNTPASAPAPWLVQDCRDYDAAVAAANTADVADREKNKKVTSPSSSIPSSRSMPFASSHCLYRWLILFPFLSLAQSPVCPPHPHPNPLSQAEAKGKPTAPAPSSKQAHQAPSSKPAPPGAKKSAPLGAKKPAAAKKRVPPAAANARNAGVPHGVSL